MTEQRTAMFPGTFDPFTNGHLDLTRRAARLFDRVVIAVAESTSKGTMFDATERCEMIRACVKGMRRVEVVHFHDLVVDCARREGAQVMIRGLRAVSDFEFEFQMALMNRRLGPEVETLFLTPKEELSYTSSRLVKQVHQLGGDVSGLVPAIVHRALIRKVPNGG